MDSPSTACADHTQQQQQQSTGAPFCAKFGDVLELKVSVPAGGVQLVGMKVWNYVLGSNVVMSTSIGVNSCVITLNDRTVWNGDLPKYSSSTLLSTLRKSPALTPRPSVPSSSSSSSSSSVTAAAVGGSGCGGSGGSTVGGVICSSPPMSPVDEGCLYDDKMATYVVFVQHGVRGSPRRVVDPTVMTSPTLSLVDKLSAMLSLQEQQQQHQHRSNGYDAEEEQDEYDDDEGHSPADDSPRSVQLVLSDDDEDDEDDDGDVM